MRLIPEIVDKTLNLYAYSHSVREFNSIQIVLVNSQVEFTSQPVAFDSKGRRGVRYSIYGLHLIRKLENYLSIKFLTVGRQTNVELGGGSNSYRCIRISDTDYNEDCETIYADDDHSAFFKCTLLANEKNWMGGTSEPGTCDA